MPVIVKQWPVDYLEDLLIFIKLQMNQMETAYTLTKSDDKSGVSITTSVSIFDSVTSLPDLDVAVCGVLSDTSYSQLLSAVCKLSDFKARMHL